MASSAPRPLHSEVAAYLCIVHYSMSNLRWAGSFVFEGTPPKPKESHTISQCPRHPPSHACNIHTTYIYITPVPLYKLRFPSDTYTHTYACAYTYTYRYLVVSPPVSVSEPRSTSNNTVPLTSYPSAVWSQDLTGRNSTSSQAKPDFEQLSPCTPHMPSCRLLPP